MKAGQGRRAPEELLRVDKAYLGHKDTLATGRCQQQQARVATVQACGALARSSVQTLCHADRRAACCRLTRSWRGGASSCA